MGSPDAEIKTPHGTIYLDLKTVIVKGGVSRKMTVRNVFYVGVIGKIKTIYYWLRYHRKNTFKDYLDSPVRYEVDKNINLHCYHNIDAEAELRQMLENANNEKS